MSSDPSLRDDRRTDLPPPDEAGLSEAGGTPARPAIRDRADFSIARVLVAVLAVVLVGGAGWAAWWYLTTREPALYAVRGVAYLDGEPMTDGIVMTKYTDNPRLLGGLSPIDENGRFDLKTNGVPGVYAGEHKIMVVLTTGGFPPIPLIPEKYSSKEETPFSVVVDADTQDNPLKLELSGGKEAPPARAASYPTPAAGQDSGGPAEADAGREGSRGSRGGTSQNRERAPQSPDESVPRNGGANPREDRDAVAPRDDFEN